MKLSSPRTDNRLSIPLANRSEPFHFPDPNALSWAFSRTTSRSVFTMVPGLSTMSKVLGQRFDPTSPVKTTATWISTKSNIVITTSTCTISLCFDLSSIIFISSQTQANWEALGTSDWCTSSLSNQFPQPAEISVPLWHQGTRICRCSSSWASLPTP